MPYPTNLPFRLWSEPGGVGDVWLVVVVVVAAVDDDVDDCCEDIGAADQQWRAAVLSCYPRLGTTRT